MLTQAAPVRFQKLQKVKRELTPVPLNTRMSILNIAIYTSPDMSERNSRLAPHCDDVPKVPLRHLSFQAEDETRSINNPQLIGAQVTMRTRDTNMRRRLAPITGQKHTCRCFLDGLMNATNCTPIFNLGMRSPVAVQAHSALETNVRDCLVIM